MITCNYYSLFKFVPDLNLPGHTFGVIVVSRRIVWSRFLDYDRVSRYLNPDDALQFEEYVYIFQAMSVDEIVNEIDTSNLHPFYFTPKVRVNAPAQEVMSYLSKQYLYKNNKPPLTECNIGENDLWDPPMRRIG